MNARADTGVFERAIESRALRAGAPAWLARLQSSGRDRFAELGFPTSRDEDWRYTDVGPILRAGLDPSAGTAGSLDAAALARYALPGLQVHTLVFVNGRHSPALSRVGTLPAGAFAGSLADALAGKVPGLDTALGQIAGATTHGFAALNTALIDDGLCVIIPAGCSIDQPIHALFLTDPAGHGAVASPRNLVLAGEGGRATVIEHHAGTLEGPYLTNALTELRAGPGARVEHYRLQDQGVQSFHVSGLHLELGPDARVIAHSVDLGGRLVRNDVYARLAAPGAECELNGLYVATGRQHVDNFTRVDHLKPNGTSREFYKGVLDGRGRSVFHGRVVVHPDAQHTDAQQTNNNLLLSRDAEADTKPQLEIYADDVKCSHGATVGQLDPDALFYLRARAIDAATARDLLTYAFANEVLNRMALAPLRESLEERLAQGLLHGRRLDELTMG